ncbi:TPA: hypothetical protein ACNVDX_003669 [Citrobacter gillenii]
MSVAEKDNVFYCDCGFSWRRGMSGFHWCEDGLRVKLAELAAELSAVDKIHNEAVFITDNHYEQCPPEVQKMIRSLAVLQIPAYASFLSEVRAQGVEMAITVVNDCSNNICAGGLAENRQYEESIVNPYLDGIHDELQEIAAQLRKGAAL